MCKGEKHQTAYDVLAYLAENPDAQDTLEGVVEWWLLEQNIKIRTAEVQEALAALVSKRLVLERRETNSRSHYRVNPRKLKKISSILKQGPEGRGV